jgi:hypothetical protein
VTATDSSTVVPRGIAAHPPQRASTSRHGDLGGETAVADRLVDPRKPLESSSHIRNGSREICARRADARLVSAATKLKGLRKTGRIYL